MRLKPFVVAAGSVVALMVVAGVGMILLAPASVKTPPITPLPPLPPAESRSTILAPVTVPLTVIRDAAERGAPRNFAGRADNPVPQLLQNADINWTVQRGAIAASGVQETLQLVTPLTGTLRATGTLSGNVQAALGNALGNLLGSNASRLGNINIKQVNANADIKGNVTINARPELLANWRIEPNIAAQVNLGDTSLSISGVRVNAPAQVKPVIDRNVNDQIAALRERLRNDPALENAARREWTKICRSIPMQGAAALGAGVPPLWLEMKPVRAIAAQPRIDAANLTLTMGLEAETRITAANTKPACPFPATLTIVPPGPGKLTVGVPIDVPFTVLDTIVQAQLVGKTFPDDGSSPVSVTVKRSAITPSGDRLLISLLVTANGKAGFFGFGGDATVHVWGRPVLDRTAQTLKLENIELALESEAAFGLLGAAARPAIPYLQQALTERAVIDLKPLAADAAERIASLIGDLQKNEQGVRVKADITALRLAGILFDSTTLRVTAEAEGAIAATITALPAP